MIRKRMIEKKRKLILSLVFTLVMGVSLLSGPTSHAGIVSRVRASIGKLFGAKKTQAPALKKDQAALLKEVKVLHANVKNQLKVAQSAAREWDKKMKDGQVKYANLKRKQQGLPYRKDGITFVKNPYGKRDIPLPPTNTK